MKPLCHSWLVTVGLALTGLWTCWAAAAEPSRVPKPSDHAAWDQYIREGWDSPFGLDYVFVLGREFRKPDLARQLGGFVGVRWVNFARVNWGEIEPKAPVLGKHTYRWAPLDEAVRQWQEQGVHIMMSLRFVCPWANATPSLKPLYLDGLLSWMPKTMADYRPRPEHQQDLRDFIAALVERYDGDGVGDMPGLLFPILHYQPGNEAYNELFWGGSVEEYGAHLREVAQAARRACPQVKIILSGVCFLPMTTLYPYPTPSRSLDYIRITRSPRDKQFDTVNRWYRGLQSAMVVKNCLVGLHAGSKKLMNGWALDSQVPLAPFPLGVGGYRSTTFNKLWPAAYTYKLLIETLDGISACRRLPMPEYAYVYECTVRGGRKVLVAFCDDHIGQNHDEPLAEMNAVLPLPDGPVRLTHIVTELDATQPKTELLRAAGGRLSIRLSEYPVFLEPQEK